MTDRYALLKAIIANPADDTPRLVYADWLTENAKQVRCVYCRGRGKKSRRKASGVSQRSFTEWKSSFAKCEKCSGRGWVSDGQPERAEFIRVQCELARTDDPGKCNRCSDPGCPVHYRWVAYDELRRRERELWNASRLNGAPHPWFGQMGFRHTANWWTTHDKPEMTIPTGRTQEGRFTFSISRGFVSAITCSWQDWLAHADSIYWHPSQFKKCLGSYLQTCPHDVGPCPFCNNTGVIPRPCPSTAQPIERVKTQPLPDLDHVMRTYEVVGEDGTIFANSNVPSGSFWVYDPLPEYSILSPTKVIMRDSRWPGIAFELPQLSRRGEMSEPIR